MVVATTQLGYGARHKVVIARQGWYLLIIKVLKVTFLKLHVDKSKPKFRIEVFGTFENLKIKSLYRHCTLHKLRLYNPVAIWSDSVMMLRSHFMIQKWVWTHRMGICSLFL